MMKKESAMRCWKRSGGYSRKTNSACIKTGNKHPTAMMKKGWAQVFWVAIFFNRFPGTGVMGISWQSGFSIRNENKVDERKDIWHASFAATWEVIKN